MVIYKPDDIVRFKPDKRTYLAVKKITGVNQVTLEFANDRYDLFTLVLKRPNLWIKIKHSLKGRIRSKQW